MGSANASTVDSSNLISRWCSGSKIASSATFAYLSHYLWTTVWRWMRRKHRRSTWKQLRRQYCNGGWWPTSGTKELIDPEKIGTTRYRYRGSIIPTPWPTTTSTSATLTTGLVESPVH